MLVVESGMNVSSGIVTFLSRKEFTFSGEDDCYHRRVISPRDITADIFFFSPKTATQRL